MSRAVKRTVILAAAVVAVTFIIYLYQGGVGVGEPAACAISCPDGTSCDATCPAGLSCDKSCDPSARCRCIEAEDASG